jgi:hypothetical protein
LKLSLHFSLSFFSFSLLPLRSPNTEVTVVVAAVVSMAGVVMVAAALTVVVAAVVSMAGVVMVAAALTVVEATVADFTAPLAMAAASTALVMVAATSTAEDTETTTADTEATAVA